MRRSAAATRPRVRHRGAEQRAGDDVARIVDPEYGRLTANAPAPRYSDHDGARPRYARAAANDVVACALGNERRVTTGVRGGNPSRSGRRRRTANLTAWFEP